MILKELDYATQDEWNQGAPGNGLLFNDEETCVTEVAHIIPHSLNALDQDGTLVCFTPFLGIFYLLSMADELPTRARPVRTFGAL